MYWNKVFCVLALVIGLCHAGKCPDSIQVEPCTCEAFEGSSELSFECSFDHMADVYQMIDNLPSNTVVGKFFLSSCPTKQLRPRLFGNVTVRTAWLYFANVKSYDVNLLEGQEHSLVSFYMLGTGLPSIPSNSIKSLRYLRTLFMSRSFSLEIVTKNSLNRLASSKILSTVDLSGNSIRSIETGSFVGLDMLEELLIVGNPLTSLDSRIFPKTMPHLHKVHFSGTELTELPSSLLQALPRSSMVNFADNKITNVKKTDLELSISKRFMLDLRGNQLNCTGDFLVVARANDQHLPGFRAGTCRYPKNLVNRTLDSLTVSDFPQS